MVEDHLDPIFFLDVFGEFVGGIDGAVLAARTAEIDGERSKAAVDIVLNGAIHDAEDVIEEIVHTAVLFKEVDNSFIPAREFFIGFIATGVVQEAAIKDKSAGITGRIFRDAPGMIGKAIDKDREKAAGTFDFIEGLVFFGVHDFAQRPGKFR